MDQRGKTPDKKKSRLVQWIFLFSKTSSPALETTQPPMQRVPAFIPGIKAAGA
jgi:hypothetical protein